MQTVRLLLPCPDPAKKTIWGDWYFARSLGAGLEKAGVSVRFEFTKKLRRLEFSGRWPFRGEIDLVIRGKKAYRPVPGRRFFIWLISQPDDVTDKELKSAEHVFVASRAFVQALHARQIECTYLPQCTDPEIFNLWEPDEAIKSDVLFVGNKRPYAPRPVVAQALKEGAALSLWGRGWTDELPEGVLKGTSIPNEELGRYYASAGAVLNDHTPDMLAHGFVSNRVYDVLACGRPILTEQMQDMPEIVQQEAFCYTKDTFGDMLEKARVVPNSHLREVSHIIRAEHSFEARGRDILKVIRS